MSPTAACDTDTSVTRSQTHSQLSGGSDEGSACTQTNLTQPCSCGGEPGAQHCMANAWSACECGNGSVGPNFAGNLRTDITFEWAKTPTGEVGDCPPGDYEGNFHGIYYSALSGNPPSPVPIANLELSFEADAGSGFRFTLAPARGGETVQRVEGVMEGTADGAFPFTADLSGELDCKAGTFFANMSNGQYSVAFEGLLPQTFEGIMVGRYDHRTHTVVDGTWDVWETSSMPPGQPSATLPRDWARDGYGGSGELAAALPTDVDDPNITVCPQDMICAGGPLGPRKLLCGLLLGPPTCVTDADCETPFPGEGVTCLKASAFSLCLRECKP